MSPSMRREWIEMFYERSVNSKMVKSPSMRREWIEMTEPPPPFSATLVSLHAEGVD